MHIKFEVPEETKRSVVYHLLMLDYLQEFYPELFAQLDKVDLSIVPYLEANSDFKLLDMLNWGTKMGYEL